MFRIDKAVRGKIWQVGLMRSSPHLVHDDRHHEQEIDSKCPEHKQFGSFEVPSRDVVLLRPDQLIVFERGQNPALDQSWNRNLRFFLALLAPS